MRSSMRAYIITSGTVFGLLVLAHIARLVLEGPRVMQDFWFVTFTVLAAALSLWAWRVLRLSA
jgi:hypothetical protein